MKTATVAPLAHGMMADFHDRPFPTQVFGFTQDKPLRLQALTKSTAFGYVMEGVGVLSVDGAVRQVDPGCYFSIPFNEKITVMGGVGFMAVRLGYTGLSMIGGPVERLGRLRYIDGCSDTLLIAPPLRGDPCFNLLHFPPGINQTRHTHPSIRCGLIHAGRGMCLTPEGDTPLLPGHMFILAPDAVHAFATDAESGMQLTVYHPDSDFGPTHEEHPMLSRTIVEGVSAKELPGIHTKVLRE